ncbi:MAG: hypothetical protein ACRDRK_21510, partial [Pseudonocardia sp.]
GAGTSVPTPVPAPEWRCGVLIRHSSRTRRRSPHHAEGRRGDGTGGGGLIPDEAAALERIDILALAARNAGYPADQPARPPRPPPPSPVVDPDEPPPF